MQENENEIRFTMRMEANLYELLRLSAKAHKRSIAKELEYIAERELTDKPFVCKQDVLNLVKASLEFSGDTLSQKQKDKYQDILENPDNYDFSSIIARNDL